MLILTMKNLLCCHFYYPNHNQIARYFFLFKERCASPKASSEKLDPLSGLQCEVQRPQQVVEHLRVTAHFSLELRPQYCAIYVTQILAPQHFNPEGGNWGCIYTWGGPWNFEDPSNNKLYIRSLFKYFRPAPSAHLLNLVLPLLTILFHSM